MTDNLAADGIAAVQAKLNAHVLRQIRRCAALLDRDRLILEAFTADDVTRTRADGTGQQMMLAAQIVGHVQRSLAQMPLDALLAAAEEAQRWHDQHPAGDQPSPHVDPA